MMNRGEVLERVIDIARAAGAAILEIYATEFEVRGKADASPVTDADERAEAIIEAGWSDIARRPDRFGGSRVERQDSDNCGAILAGRSDGRTKEFIGRNGEFTVNIA
jgi:3'(2'), 5'-bisphosphate nucleotidase